MHTPYFYIIEDVITKQLYVGSKFGSDANPSTFWIEGGYITSSKTVKDLVEEFGLKRFSIRKLKPMKNAYEYETRFLQKVDAKNNPKFYNGHNNDGSCAPPNGTEEYKQMIMKKYGVEHPSHLEEIKKKISCSLMGHKHTEESKKKMSETRNKRIKNGEIKIIKRKHSEETKKKISEINKKRFENQRGTFYGKKHSEETKKIITSKVREKVACPHCSKEGTVRIMKRWHFDKCKEKN